MTIQIDSREKARAIVKILETFDRRGIGHFVSKLPVGDYMSLDNPRIVVDRKQSMSEVVSNLCQQHKRFRNEIERAGQIGVRIVFLVEHGRRIQTLEDVRKWENPRLKDHPLAMSGERAYKVMRTLTEKYGVEWQFCEKHQTGDRILEILGADGPDHIQ